MELAQNIIKKQFDKKKKIPQGLKEEDNIWLEVKKIHSKKLSKKLDQKKYRLFRILKDIGQGVFQLKLPEEQIIHNMFNEDLLTCCKEPQFQEQCIDLAPPSRIINEDEHDQWITKTGLPLTKEAIEDYQTRISSQNL